MSRLENAEFAFCLVTAKAIYYGRDCLGRRSLLECHVTAAEETSNDQSHSIRWGLASVAVEPKVLETMCVQWKEVLPGRVFEYDLASSTVRSLELLPLEAPLMDLTVIPTPMIPAEMGWTVSPTMWHASLQLEEILRIAIQQRLPAGLVQNRNNNDAATTTSDDSNKLLLSDNTVAPVGASVAVLFSGGLDSAVLASLALDLISPTEPLELWNVSFGPDPDAAADRKAACAAVRELSKQYPSHDLRFICMDVDWKEVVEYEAHILQLLHPKPATTMDFNIATALWFASRGKGTWICSNADDASSTARIPYASSARILLLGMGADEQMAGYGRHRKAYVHGGWSKLRTELDLDLHRLWERNLGRDDRIVSDHGREARFPFLDTNVMKFLQGLPLADVCDLTLAPGIGDKQILRQIALRKGLLTAGGLVKRAIQFGSRISHVSDTQRFGSRRQAKGDKHIFSSATDKE